MKQTEIGLIPDDWEVKNINKECTIKARIGWQGLKSTEYLDYGNYILITGTDFNNGFINWKSCSYVTKWRFNQDKNIQIKQGDVLVTKDGTIGKIAFLGSIPMQGTLNSGVFVVRPKNNEKIDSVFLSLIFKSLWFDSFLEQITSGSTIVHLYQKDFVKFDFPLPPLPEQQRIAKALSDVDALISTTEKLLQKKKNIKQGTMQELLTGKKRLSGFAKSNNTKMTELGEIPEDWEVNRLGDYVSIVRGGSPRPIQDYLTTNSDGINWIKIGDVKPEDKYIVATEEKIISEGKSRSREVHKGDFILSNSMSFGRPYILQIDGCIHDGWLAIQNYQETFDSDFLYYLLGSDEIYKQYIEMAAGSSVQNLNKQKVRNLIIPILDKEEQNSIAKILSDMDNEIDLLNTKLEKYRNLKTAMMQQLLTGKIRLGEGLLK